MNTSSSSLFLTGALLLGLLLGGCQSPRQALEELSTRHGYRREILPTQPFPLLVGIPQRSIDTSRLRVYLEGDGHAWATATQPSLAPSPHNLLVAGLAFDDPQPAIYLARPCQFVTADNCDPALWTNRRYSAEVLRSLDQALDQLKSRYHNRDFELIGYSGGSALALLLAAQRDDIAQVQTLGGNLSPRLWAQLQRLAPLDGSLDPLDYRERLARLPQRHLAGADDRVVPSRLLQEYRDAIGPAPCIESAVLPGVSHDQGWTSVWPDWRDRPLACPKLSPTSSSK